MWILVYIFDQLTLDYKTVCCNALLFFIMFCTVLYWIILFYIMLKCVKIWHYSSMLHITSSLSLQSLIRLNFRKQLSIINVIVWLSWQQPFQRKSPDLVLINILSLCRDSFDGIMAQITHINIAEWLIKAGRSVGEAALDFSRFAFVWLY